MPSVFTIEGVRRKKRKSRKSSKKKSRGMGETHGKCKTVRKKGGCTIQLCHVGKSKKHPSGWSFKKGTSRCPR